MAKRKPGQLPLDDVGAPRRKGSTERAAEGDLRVMRNLASIGAGMGALEVAYRLVAREVDRAETEADRWGKLKATSELRAIRERLASMVPLTSSTEADEFWSTMSHPSAGSDGD